jgi:hypothetical protein
MGSILSILDEKQNRINIYNILNDIETKQTDCEILETINPILLGEFAKITSYDVKIIKSKIKSIYEKITLFN